MSTLEIDEATDQHLEFAAAISGLTKAQIVAQLVWEARTRVKTSIENGHPDEIAIHADYDGHRTSALFIRGPGRIDITDGPLAGSTYRTPSEAARAVVACYKPTVSPHRNGWDFWIVTATGASLQSIRPKVQR